MATRYFFAVVVSLLCLTVPAAASDWTASIDERSGLPIISHGGMPAVSSGFAFWGSNWSWADTQVSFDVVEPYRYQLSGKSKALDFDITADIRKANERQWSWDFRLDARSARSDTIGGGMVFRFDLGSFGAEMGEPVLLPGKRGWVWGKEGGRRIELRFEPPLADVFFERDAKSEVRAFFYKSAIISGSLRVAATLSLAGDIEPGLTVGERFGLSDPASWPADNIDRRTSPVDLSFLNEPEKPAGKRGMVKAAGEALVFADGTPVRFWGTNLTAYTLFANTPDATCTQAKRLSALGFNMVRIHHHDSFWVNPNIFGNRKSAPDTQRISPEMFDRIAQWVKCLKEEGIYLWLDLHVQRTFLAGDNIYGFDEIRKGKKDADLKGFAYVNISIRQAMKRFAEDYLARVNPYTGLAFKDDPAIAAILITNENDITHHFGNALLPDQNVPDHSRLYMREAESFAVEQGLPKDKTWRSWEHGPSKLFLNDLERRFNVEMIEHLSGLGVKVPIATTNTWGNNPLSSLPALTSGDVIDAHSYGGVGQLEKNPLVTGGLVHWIAAAQVAGRPLTVTEWNAEPFPTPDRHLLPLYVAGMAAHQGWDALMQYAYSQEPFRGAGSASNWHAYNDPSLLATLPAAALLYRRGDVREATTTYFFDPGMTLFDRPISPANSPALRTAAEKGKLLVAIPQTKELPWLEGSTLPANAIVLRDPEQAVLPASAQEVTTDTGELRRNWTKGIYTIDTPRTQAAMGWIGGETIALSDVEMRIKTRNASVAVQSLDGAPLARAKELLISLGTRSVPKAGNRTPFHVEPLEGEISIRAPQGKKLYKGGVLQEITEVPMNYRDGRYTLQFYKSLQTRWLVLK